MSGENKKRTFFTLMPLFFMYLLADSCSLKIIINLDVLAFIILKWSGDRVYLTATDVKNAVPWQLALNITQKKYN